MTIHAYPAIYVNRAQTRLGDAFDYAINTQRLSGDDFVTLFLVSSISKRIENGEPLYLCGKSGPELVLDILHETRGTASPLAPAESFIRSTEYWIGWALAYYQWFSSRSFQNIFAAVSYTELEMLYYPLHEADLSKFVDIMDKRLKEYYVDTNLKRLRTSYGLSQSQLASQSGVSLRSIQMYEQRHKDINKASAVTIFRLAKSLGCSMEALLEAE